MGPKRSLETNISEKGNLPGDKIFGLFFRFIGYDKSQGVIYQFPQGFLRVIPEVLRFFLYHLNGCWKHSFLKQKLFFEWKIYIGQIFLALSSMKNLKEYLIYIHMVFWKLLCKI